MKNSDPQPSVPTYKAGIIHARAYRKLKKLLSTELTEHSLTLPQWAFLGIVNDYQIVHFSKITEILEVKPPFTSRLGQQLTLLGLVSVGTDPRDGRKKIVSLTSEGKIQYSYIESVLKLRLKNYLININEDYLRTYYTVMQQLADISD